MMWKQSRNLLSGAVGMLGLALAVTPALAHGWQKQRHHGFKVVQKLVFIKPHYNQKFRRFSHSRRYWHRKSHYRWRSGHIHHHRVEKYPVYRPTLAAHSSHYHGEKATAGTLIGAAIGALTGSFIGKGRGKLVTTVIGGVIGAAVGGSVGNSMDKADHVYAQNALETAKTGQRVTWINPDSNSEYILTPTRTYQRENGQHCREFTTWGWIDGFEEELHGTACRLRNGTWRKVS